MTLSKETYDDRRERYISRVKSVLDYAKEENVCRSQVLLAYFGESNVQACGQCDICLKRKETEISSELFEKIKNEIFLKLNGNLLTINLLLKVVPYPEKKVIEVVRFLIDNNHIEQNKLLQLNLIDKF